MKRPFIRNTIRLVAVGVGLNVLVTSATMAAVTSYTSSATFFADLATNLLSPITEDFDSTAASTTISDGGSVGGITFDSFNFLSGTDLIVEDDFATTSGSNYLGVDFAANSFLIIGGDEFDLGFANSFAIGLFIITAETPNFSIFDNDVQLTAGGGTAFLDVDAVDQVLPGGDDAFFLGLIDPAAQFTSALLRYDPAAVNAMTFNIDDITTAIPEPSRAALLALAGIGVLTRRRR